MSKYEADLGKDRANYEPLSPVSFLARSALAYPGKAAIIDCERIITYAEMWRRSGPRAPTPRAECAPIGRT